MKDLLEIIAATIVMFLLGITVEYGLYLVTRSKEFNCCDSPHFMSSIQVTSNGGYYLLERVPLVVTSTSTVLTCKDFKKPDGTPAC